MTNRPSTLILWVKDDFSDEGSEVPVRFSSNEGLRVPAAQPSCERSFFHLCSELYHNFGLQSSGLFFQGGQRCRRAGDRLPLVLSIHGGQNGLQKGVLNPYEVIRARREPPGACWRLDKNATITSRPPRGIVPRRNGLANSKRSPPAILLLQICRRVLFLGEGGAVTGPLCSPAHLVGQLLHLLDGRKIPVWLQALRVQSFMGCGRRSLELLHAAA